MAVKNLLSIHTAIIYSSSYSRETVPLKGIAHVFTYFRTLGATLHILGPLVQHCAINAHVFTYIRPHGATLRMYLHVHILGPLVPHCVY